MNETLRVQSEQENGTSVEMANPGFWGKPGFPPENLVFEVNPENFLGFEFQGIYIYVYFLFASFLQD